MKRSSRWLSRGFGLLFGLLLAANVFLPQALAADACNCFCGDRDLGAFEAGSYDSANECAQTCSDADVTYVGCFTNEDTYPENSNLCWTQDECTKYPVDIAGTTYQGEWGGQNAYCSKQSVTNAEMGYCYGPMLPVTLNVPIMGVTEISAIGDYVNLLYTYAIPLAGIFGALMFTIAGFQYMTAGGDKGAVSKAKARMTNTVTGIIFLMSVYVIAYLIDPRLTRFNELRPPMVKKAVMVDDTTTCEALAGYGYDISPESGACGEKGEITGDDNVDLNIANPPEVGDECMLSGCDDKSKSCVLKGDNSGGQCVACDEISSLNDDLGLVPSAALCSQVAAKAKSRSSTPSNIYVCAFDNDFSNFSQADAIGADECVQYYTEENEYINCQVLKDFAVDKEDACSTYEEKINASSYGLEGGGHVAELFNYGSADQIEDFKEIFGSLCEQDICSISELGAVPQGSCNFIDTNVVEDFLDMLTGVFSQFDNYACTGTQTLTEAAAAAEESSGSDWETPSTY